MILLKCDECGKVFQSNRNAKRFCSCECSNKYNGRKRQEKMDDVEADVVWSCGGGIQSTALAVLIWQGKLPKPKYAFMADCGYESEKTYKYVSEVIAPKLKEVGVDFNLVNSSDYVNVELMDKNGYCNLPAFRKKPDGTVSHLSTRCNGTWKQAVMRKWLRDHGVEKCVDWVGISTDEARRGGKSSGVKWIKNEYPLLDLGMSRKDCVELIKSAGWEMPARTSCIMCPQRTMFEWLRLKVECPEDFERACEIEESIRKIDPDLFLNPKCIPLREILETE